ncbi:T9SS type A sorting domain-containing protein [Alkaliflexus imshenetskii]|uniref:T9SS type A sorting domain-containing protein n=1 Tax=Alkaliflexus imshenetskii TaxID=286730 RepID=UPI00138B1056|nr:T9SS type A sorting domain-containing protein [Alkaliflexus imshenetskii]
MKFIFVVILLCVIHLTYAQNYIKNYQYWFNNNRNEVVNLSTYSNNAIYSLKLQIPVDEMPNGLHTLHMRFQDNESRWSSATSHFFYKMPVEVFQESSISLYEYWFNNAYSSAVSGATSGEALLDFSQQIDVSSLVDGLHTFNIRFSDSRNRWSSTFSQFFYKMPATSFTNNAVSSYQYWFNRDVDKAVSDVTTNSKVINFSEVLDVNELADGLHTFHIRFGDSRNQWSSTVSHFFYKMPNSHAGENLVKAYQYWFNDDDASMYNVTLSVPVNPLNLLSEIELPYLALGDNYMHIRFLDTQNRWSGVVSELFTLDNCEPTRVGNISGKTIACQGQESEFEVDASLNVTDFVWALVPIEAGTITSQGRHASILWNSDFSGAVTLSVEGSNPCGSLPPSSFDLVVHPTPILEIMPSVAICEGEEVELIVSSASGTVSWNVENTLVSPIETTVYTAVVSSEHCGDKAETVTVNVMPLPWLFIMPDEQICPGVVVNLEAESNGVVTWNVTDIAVSPNATTSYQATATLEGCSVSDVVEIIVKTVEYEIVSTADELIVIADNASFQWYTCGSDAQVIAGEIYEQFSPTQSGFYAVSVSRDGCNVMSECIQFVKSSVDDVSYNQKIILYPNPTSDLITLVFNERVNLIALSVFNMNGRLMFEKVSMTTDSVIVDLSNLSNGIYLLELLIDGKYATVKVLKE